MKLTKEEQIKGSELLQELVSRAHENVSFKEQLINNPVETIRGFNPEVQVPQGMRILVEDQSDDSFLYLNIPPQVNLDNIELSDEQMEMVSGGIALISLSAAAIVGLGALAVGSIALGVALYNHATN